MATLIDQSAKILSILLGSGTQGKWKLQGRTTYQGLPIAIENKKGSVRSGVEPSGKKWSVVMPFDYGYVEGTEGKDGDEVDVFLGPNEKASHVFVVHQRVNKPGAPRYDEDKVFLGWNSANDAKKAYHAAYNNVNLFHSMTMMSFDEFRTKLKSHSGKKIHAVAGMNPKKCDFCGAKLNGDDFLERGKDGKKIACPACAEKMDRLSASGISRRCEYCSMSAGGPGSGCHGPNCGRPKGPNGEFIVHQHNKKLKDFVAVINKHGWKFSKGNDNSDYFTKAGQELRVNHMAWWKIHSIVGTKKKIAEGVSHHTLDSYLSGQETTTGIPSSKKKIAPVPTPKPEAEKTTGSINQLDAEKWLENYGFKLLNKNYDHALLGPSYAFNNGKLSVFVNAKFDWRAMDPSKSVAAKEGNGIVSLSTALKELTKPAEAPKKSGPLPGPMSTVVKSFPNWKHSALSSDIDMYTHSKTGAVLTVKPVENKYVLTQTGKDAKSGLGSTLAQDLTEHEKQDEVKPVEPTKTSQFTKPSTAHSISLFPNWKYVGSGSSTDLYTHSKTGAVLTVHNAEIGSLANYVITQAGKDGKKGAGNHALMQDLAEHEKQDEPTTVGPKFANPSAKGTMASFPDWQYSSSNDGTESDLYKHSKTGALLEIKKSEPGKLQTYTLYHNGQKKQGVGVTSLSKDLNDHATDTVKPVEGPKPSGPIHTNSFMKKVIDDNGNWQHTVSHATADFYKHKTSSAELKVEQPVVVVGTNATNDFVLTHGTTKQKGTGSSQLKIVLQAHDKEIADEGKIQNSPEDLTKKAALVKAHGFEQVANYSTNDVYSKETPTHSIGLAINKENGDWEVSADDKEQKKEVFNKKGNSLNELTTELINLHNFTSPTAYPKTTPSTPKSSTNPDGTNRTPEVLKDHLKSIGWQYTHTDENSFDHWVSPDNSKSVLVNKTGSPPAKWELLTETSKGSGVYNKETGEGAANLIPQLSKPSSSPQAPTPSSGEMEDYLKSSGFAYDKSSTMQVKDYVSAYKNGNKWRLQSLTDPTVEASSVDEIKKYMTSLNSVLPGAPALTREAAAKKIVELSKGLTKTKMELQDDYASWKKGSTYEENVANAKGKGLYAEVFAHFGLTKDHIDRVQSAISSWTGSTYTAMHRGSSMVVNDAPNAPKNLILEHEITKAILRKTDGDAVHLHRGIKASSDDEAVNKTVKILKQVKAEPTLFEHAQFSMKTRGADPWTDKQSTADGFKGSGIRLEMDIPTDNIISSYKTNPKAFASFPNEHEYIVAWKKDLIPIMLSDVQASANSNYLHIILDIRGEMEIENWLHPNWRSHVNIQASSFPTRVSRILSLRLLAGGPGSGVYLHKKTGRKTVIKKGRRKAQFLPPESDKAAKHAEYLEKVRQEQQQARDTAKHGGLNNVHGKPILSAKQALAVKSTVIADKAVHDKAEEVENLVTKYTKGTKSSNNSPFDVTKETSSGVHGIEVKALLLQTNDKITMKRAAIERKEKWAKQNKADMHTVAVDLRGTGITVYYRKGVGSFRLGSMTKVEGGLKGLSKLFA